MSTNNQPNEELFMAMIAALIVMLALFGCAYIWTGYSDGEKNRSHPLGPIRR